MVDCAGIWKVVRKVGAMGAEQVEELDEKKDAT